MNWIDLRDRYGITQLIFDEGRQNGFELAKTLGREFVIQVKGIVIEREAKTKTSQRVKSK
jgi:aspartyl-tRNA synthetase